MKQKSVREPGTRGKFKGVGRQRAGCELAEDRVVEHQAIAARNACALEVGDDIDVGCAKGGIEHEAIVAGRARQGVAAGAAEQRVGTAPASQPVRATTAA